MPFRAFWTAFMTIFHVVKYFPTSLASLVSPPCLLRIVDWSSCMPVFISNKASLAMLQTSNSWSNHFLWWSWMNACWVRGNRSNLSTQSCKYWRSLSLWHIDDDEVASEVFSLHKYSTLCGISGCGAEGKLLERAWWVAMFSSSGLRMCRVECTNNSGYLPCICWLFIMGSWRHEESLLLKMVTKGDKTAVWIYKKPRQCRYLSPHSQPPTSSPTHCSIILSCEMTKNLYRR